jgi:hypothetical protein
LQGRGGADLLAVVVVQAGQMEQARAGSAGCWSAAGGALMECRRGVLMAW